MKLLASVIGEQGFLHIQVVTRVDTCPSEHLLQIIHKIHKAGVRHRDIGPRNIVMNEEDNFFVIDFDMAELLSTSDAAERMAREALLMEHTASGAADWENRYYSF